MNAAEKDLGALHLVQAPDLSRAKWSLDVVMKKISGSHNADILRGTDHFDVLWGLAGADKLSSGAGADTLWGGDGNDSMYGGEGADILISRLGGDLMDSGSGFDCVTYADAAERVIINLATEPQGGWAKGDTLLNIEAVVGSKFGDLLTGSWGANTLNCASGNDLLDGAAGNDLLIAGSGNDTLLGGSGGDTLRFYASTQTNQAVIADFEIGLDVIGINLEGNVLMERTPLGT